MLKWKVDREVDGEERIELEWRWGVVVKICGLSESFCVRIVGFYLLCIFFV